MASISLNQMYHIIRTGGHQLLVFRWLLAYDCHLLDCQVADSIDSLDSLVHVKCFPWRDMITINRFAFKGQVKFIEVCKE